MNVPIEHTTNHDVTTSAHRIWDVAAHLSPLIIGLNVSIAAGKAYGWIGLLLPLGPLIVAAAMRAAGQGTPRGLRSLVGFTIVSGVGMALCLLAIQLGHQRALLAYAFPLALLVFTMMFVNFVLVIVSRAVRAWKGQQFDYPWVFSPVARLVGLPPIWEE